MTISDGQIMITGCYRTGSTYLANLLDNCPSAAIEMHTVNFMRFCHGRYDPIEDPSNQEALVRDVADRISKREGLKLDVESVLARSGTEGDPYARLYDLIMDSLFLSDDVRVWGEKNQLLWTKIPDFLDMFPAGKVIHLHRDPRSILASFKNFTYAPEPAYLGAIFNALGSMQASQRYREQFRERRYTTVRYEDLVRHPEPTLKELFSFLDLPSSHPLMSQEGWTDSEGEPWEPNSAFDSGDEFDPEAAIERWKKHLEPWETALCEVVNEDLMGAYGYSPSKTPRDWQRMLAPFLEDEDLAEFLGRWIDTGVGVEQFPTDPLDPTNWTENRENA